MKELRFREEDRQVLIARDIFFEVSESAFWDGEKIFAKGIYHYLGWVFTDCRLELPYSQYEPEDGHLLVKLAFYTNIFPTEDTKVLEVGYGSLEKTPFREFEKFRKEEVESGSHDGWRGPTPPRELTKEEKDERFHKYLKELYQK